MGVLLLRDLIEQARVIELDPRTAGEIVVKIGEKDHRPSDPEAEELLLRYATLLNQAMKERQERNLWASIPVTEFVTPEDL